MGLEAGLDAALSGLKANQEAFNVLAQNIANANNEKYSRQRVELDSVYIGNSAAGVEVSGIARITDEVLVGELRNYISDAVYNRELKQYNEKMQVYLGDPNSSTINLNGALNELFIAMDNLALNPEMVSVKTNAVQKAISLAHFVSSLAENLVQLQYQADQDYFTSINNINNYTEQIASLNSQIFNTSNTDVDNNLLKDQRDHLMNKLAEEIDISTFSRGNNMIGITGGNGFTLVDGSLQYKLNYSPVNSYEGFIDSPYIVPTTLTPQFISAQMQLGTNIVNGGAPDQIQVPFSSGRLKALEELRDTDIPNSLSQLNQLAKTIEFAVNAVHNTGSPFPPINEYTGTTQVFAAQETNFSGQARIAVINEQGQPINGPDNTPWNPLLLDFSNITSGSAYGLVSMQTIIDEINQYFYYDPRLTRTEMANLYDVRIASDSATISPGGNFSFDFELYNNSEIQTSSNFQLLNVTVLDSSGATIPGAVVTSPLPGPFTVDPGQRIRTQQVIDIDFSGTSGGPYSGPYNIQTEVMVTSSDGEVNLSTLNFVIDDNPVNPNIMNERYVASSVIGGQAKIVSPQVTNQLYLYAQLVDSNGNPVTNGDPGYVQIKSMNNELYYIAIDDLTSQDEGYLTTAATLKGLGHYLGLNNLFVEQPEVTNSAVNMAVRADIAADPGLISTSGLFQTQSYQTLQQIGIQPATGSITFSGALPNVGDTLTIDGTTFTFVTSATANNQITIGANWPSTLTNITNVLNAENMTTYGTVNKAAYANNGNDELTITYKYNGQSGNLFSLAANLTSGGTASINNGAAAAAPTGYLAGGIDDQEVVTLYPNSYQLASGSGAVPNNMSNIIRTSYSFGAAGGLPSFSDTLGGYSSAIIGYRSGQAALAETNYQQADLIREAFYNRLRAVSGVNIDEELSYTIIYQNAYQASATVISTIQKMFDTLFKAFFM